MNVKKNQVNRGRARRCLLAVCICVTILLGGCTIESPSTNTTVRINREFKETELFYLEEELCSLGEAKLFLMNQRNLYTSRYGEEIWEAIYENQPLYTYLEENVYDFLIRLKGMVLMAKANDIQLSQDDHTLINMASDHYDQQLSQAEKDYCGVTREDITKAFSDYFLANRLFEEITADAQREISDDEARVITIQMIYLPMETVVPGAETTAAGPEGGAETTAAGPEGGAGTTAGSGAAEPESGAQTYPASDAAGSEGGDEPDASAEETGTEPETTGEPATGDASALSLITELYRRVTRDEEDFLTLAETYSKNSWVEAQVCRGELEEDVEEAAFVLSSGEISKVITGEDGYYLIKCVNNHEEELTKQHREELIESWKQELFKTKYDEFVQTLYLRFNDAAWETIDFSAETPEYTVSFYSCYDEYLAGNE